MDEAQKTKHIGRWIVKGVIALIVLILFFGSIGTVDAGDRGVRVRLGNIVGAVDPGIYFKMPFIETIHQIDVRTQSVVYERENPLASASLDLQDVNIATVTNYHVDPTKVIELYRQYKTLENHEEKVIRPRIRDTVKAVASGFTAGELITRRAELADRVAKTLNERLDNTFVIVEQTNITNIEFSKSFSDAIEAKVTAVQNAEAAKNKLEQVKFEAEQRITQAKGEAEAIRIQAQAITQQGGAEYVRLKAVEKWDGVLPVYQMGNSTPLINLSR